MEERYRLNPKQKRFAQEYVVDLNGTQAAIRAGYSEKTANEQAARLLANVSVQAIVQEAMQERDKRVEISQDKILLELSRIAFGDLRGVVAWNGRAIELKDSDSLSEDDAATVSEVAETAAGALKIKRYDKVKALELIMRHKGMLNDKLNLNLPPEAIGVATCEQKALAARERLLALRAERGSQTFDHEEISIGVKS